MASQHPGPGFFYILSRPKPDHLDEYNEWYNTEHGPLRMKLDFVLTGYRYKCVDPDPSLFLAMYDLSRVGGLAEDEYIRVREEKSPRESVMFDEKLDLLDRRIYTELSSVGQGDGPAPVIMAVAFVIKDDLADEVHRWYEEEHTQDITQIPGWRRTRRFQLAEADDVREGYTELLAVHDFDQDNGLGGLEHERAKSRPWRLRMLGLVESRDNKLFHLFHQFQASDYRSPPPPR